MFVSFTPSITHDPRYSCPGCDRPLGEKGVVSHNHATDAANIHAIHEVCLRACARSDSWCPTCHQATHLDDTHLSLKESFSFLWRKDPSLVVDVALSITVFACTIILFQAILQK